MHCLWAWSYEFPAAIKVHCIYALKAFFYQVRKSSILPDVISDMQRGIRGLSIPWIADVVVTSSIDPHLGP